MNRNNYPSLLANLKKSLKKQNQALEEQKELALNLQDALVYSQNQLKNRSKIISHKPLMKTVSNLNHPQCNIYERLKGIIGKDTITKNKNLNKYTMLSRLFNKSGNKPRFDAFNTPFGSYRETHNRDQYASLTSRQRRTNAEHQQANPITDRYLSKKINYNINSMQNFNLRLSRSSKSIELAKQFISKKKEEQTPLRRKARTEMVKKLNIKSSRRKISNQAKQFNKLSLTDFKNKMKGTETVGHEKEDIDQDLEIERDNDYESNSKFREEVMNVLIKRKASKNDPANNKEIKQALDNLHNDIGEEIEDSDYSSEQDQTSIINPPDTTKNIFKKPQDLYEEEEPEEGVRGRNRTLFTDKNHWNKINELLNEEEEIKPK